MIAVKVKKRGLWHLAESDATLCGRLPFSDGTWVEMEMFNKYYTPLGGYCRRCAQLLGRRQAA